MDDSPIRAERIIASNSEDAAPYRSWQRMIEILYGRIMPFAVECQKESLSSIENRDKVRIWCGQNGVKSFRMTVDRMIYFDQMEDATLFLLAHR